MKCMKRFVVALAGVLTVAGCAETGRTGTLTGPEGEAAGSVGAAGADGQLVARAFALALSEPEQRARVRDAMRASRFGEHKLVLQEFLATEPGQRFLAAAAQRAAVETAVLQDAVGKLPPMDFYAPFREHRRGWRATGDVVFAVTLDQNAPEITGYTVRGASRTYRLADGVPAEPMLMLHPAEEKFRRVNPQADAPGAVIQDAADGQVAGKLVYRGRDGRLTSIELADLPAGVVTETECPRRGCDAAGLSPSYSTASTSSTAGSIWMDQARIGFNTEWGDEDVRWRAWAKKSYYPNAPWQDPVVTEGMVFHDANPSSWYTVNSLWVSDFVFYPNAQYVDADVYEIDPTFDDYFGAATNYNCPWGCGTLRFTKLTSSGDREYAQAQISNR
jgi:hypothetical protein